MYRMSRLGLPLLRNEVYSSGEGHRFGTASGAPTSRPITAALHPEPRIQCRAGQTIADLIAAAHNRSGN